MAKGTLVPWCPLYEVSESDDQNIPFSLYHVLCSLGEAQRDDELALFLCVMYILVLESGFRPDHEGPAAVWTTRSQTLPPSMYDVRRMRHYSQDVSNIKYVENGQFEWQFKVDFCAGMLHVVFVPISTKDVKRLYVVNVITPGLNQALSKVYNIKKFVPNPQSSKLASKFSQLKELSNTFKSLLWIARGQILFKQRLCDRSSLEFLPVPVLRKISGMVKCTRLKEFFAARAARMADNNLLPRRVTRAWRFNRRRTRRHGRRRHRDLNVAENYLL